MNKFVIITDSTSDLPQKYVEEENISVVKLSYTIDYKTYGNTEELSSKAFYSKMRSGIMPTTALVNPATAKEAAEKYLQNGKDVLYIAFSSALSGSCQSALLAAKELDGKYPNKMAVIDSLCASLGEGLLVHYANEYRKKGKTLDETVQYIESLKNRICHYFTVNDLFHLYRGGRVTKGKAIVGSILKIKPILYVNEEGKLIPLKNSFGRKKALMSLITSMENKIDISENETIFISHGDCPQDAEYVAKKITERFGIFNILIGDIGPVIGAHAGPDTVALFFVGKDKKEE